MTNFVHQLKRVKARHIIEAWKLPVAALIAPIYKFYTKSQWIICEDANEARDNGYWIFKYLREYQPEQKCVYAIKKSSPDYEKVASLGKTVEFGSLAHWIIYFAAEKKISSQKAGNPNAALFYFLEVYGFLRDKRVFLQHGVIKDDLKWLYYDATKFSRFICGAYPEYEFVKGKFGYPEKNVRYTGLCRFDGLHDFQVDNRLILIMPTWREWIADEDKRLIEFEGTTDITKTNYFLNWVGFLSDERLKSISERYGVKFVFFPHRNMQKYLDYFPKLGEYVQIVGAREYDVQDLLRRAALMITDYSSVFFDFIYMKKPLIFYQFDYNMFREHQYSEGYFNYKDNPFAQSFCESEGVFQEIEKFILNNYNISEEYIRAHAQYFPLFDNKNCKRVYETIKEL